MSQAIAINHTVKNKLPQDYAQEKKGHMMAHLSVEGTSTFEKIAVRRVLLHPDNHGIMFLDATGATYPKHDFRKGIDDIAKRVNMKEATTSGLYLHADLLSPAAESKKARAKNASGMIRASYHLHRMGGAQVESFIPTPSLANVVLAANIFTESESSDETITFAVASMASSPAKHKEHCIEAMNRMVPVAIPNNKLAKKMLMLLKKYEFIKAMPAYGEISGSLFQIDRELFFSSLIPEWMPNLNIQSSSLNAFMAHLGESFIDDTKKRLEPVYSENNITVTRKLKSLRRDAYPSQERAIQAAVKGFEDGKPTIILGMEMSTGKSFTSVAIGAVLDAKNNFIITPAPVAPKWAREIKETVLDANILNANDWTGTGHILKLARNNEINDTALYTIMGRARMRMSKIVQKEFATQTNYFLKAQLNRLIKDMKKKLVIAKLKKDPELETLREEFAELNQRMDQEVKLPICPHCSERVRAKIDSLNDKGREIKAYLPAFIHQLAEFPTCHKCFEPLFSFKRKNKAHYDMATQRHQLMVKWLSDVPGVSDTKAEEVIFALGLDGIIAMIKNGALESLAKTMLGKTSRRIEAAVENMSGRPFTLTAPDIPPYLAVKRMKTKFDLAIIDEMHEDKGGNSEQGVAAGTILSKCDKSMLLSGSLLGGYASDLFNILFRTDPSHMKDRGYRHGGESRYQLREGVVENITVEKTDENGEIKKEVKVRKIPGFSPEAITLDLLPCTVFIKLADIERDVMEMAQKEGGELHLMPSYTETFIAVEPSEEVLGIHGRITPDIILAMKDKKNKRKLGMVTNALLASLDRPNYVTETGYSTMPPWLAEDKESPKEQQLVKIIKREKAEGRRCVVLANFTQKLDCQERIKTVLARNGLNVAIMKSSVPSEQREAWIDKQVEKDVDAIILHARLIMTGLDIDFPTFIHAQTTRSTYVTRQVNRRPWRLGFTRPVRIFYLAYQKTVQELELSFMAAKIRTALDTEGNTDESALDMLLNDDDSSLAAIARAIETGTRIQIPDAISDVDDYNSDHEYHADINYLPTEKEVKRMFQKEVEDMGLLDFLAC